MMKFFKWIASLLTIDETCEICRRPETANDVLYPYISSEAGIMMCETCYRNAEQKDIQNGTTRH